MPTIPALRPFHFAVVAGLWFVSIGLALAADRIERSYVRRKFRVIASVNRLLEALRGDRVDVAAVRAELRIAGDTDDETVAIVVLWLAAGGSRVKDYST